MMAAFPYMWYAFMLHHFAHAANINTLLIRDKRQVPASTLLGFWPLNQQFETQDISSENRDATNIGAVTPRTGSHYLLWTGEPDSYITIPEVVGSTTDGYVHIYAELIIDSSTSTPGEAQQILFMGDNICSVRSYYLEGFLYLELHNDGTTTFVEKLIHEDTLMRVYLEYNICQEGNGVHAREFDCLAITDADTFSYELAEIAESSFCPNLYSAADVGKDAGFQNVGLQGTVSCLAFYTGRIESNDYYAYQSPSYLHDNYCTGNKTKQPSTIV